MMYTWLRYMEMKDDVVIRSRINNGKECRVGKYPVDGMTILPNKKVRIYEFNGCFNSSVVECSRNGKD